MSVRRLYNNEDLQPHLPAVNAAKSQNSIFLKMIFFSWKDEECCGSGGSVVSCPHSSNLEILINQRWEILASCSLCWYNRQNCLTKCSEAAHFNWAVETFWWILNPAKQHWVFRSENIFPVSHRIRWGQLSGVPDNVIIPLQKCVMFKSWEFQSNVQIFITSTHHLKAVRQNSKL